MSIESSAVGALRGASRAGAAARPRIAWLRGLAIAAGTSASILFVVIGLGYELQLYCRRLDLLLRGRRAGRLGVSLAQHLRPAVRLSVLLPAAETYVGLTGDARGGIDIYGLLFFGSQGDGPGGDYAADRSQGRIIFCAACVSVAALCPLVSAIRPRCGWRMHCSGRRWRSVTMRAGTSVEPQG